jgi:hypothetical protein
LIKVFYVNAEKEIKAVKNPRPERRKESVGWEEKVTKHKSKPRAVTPETN